MKKMLLLALFISSVCFSQNKIIAYSLSPIPGGGLWIADNTVSSVTYSVAEIGFAYWAITATDKTQPIVFFSLLKVGEILRLTEVLNKNGFEISADNRLRLKYTL